MEIGILNIIVNILIFKVNKNPSKNLIIVKSNSKIC